MSYPIIRIDIIINISEINGPATKANGMKHNTLEFNDNSLFDIFI